jgi:hypothetical protein
VAVDVELGEPADGDLLDVGQQVVWNPLGVLADLAGAVRADGVEVAQQDDAPPRVRAVVVPRHILQDKLQQRPEKHREGACLANDESVAAVTRRGQREHHLRDLVGGFDSAWTFLPWSCRRGSRPAAWHPRRTGSPPASRTQSPTTRTPSAHKERGVSDRGGGSGAVRRRNVTLAGERRSEQHVPSCSRASSWSCRG